MGLCFGMAFPAPLWSDSSDNLQTLSLSTSYLRCPLDIALYLSAMKCRLLGGRFITVPNCSLLLASALHRRLFYRENQDSAVVEVSNLAQGDWRANGNSGLKLAE